MAVVPICASARDCEKWGENAGAAEGLFRSRRSTCSMDADAFRCRRAMVPADGLVLAIHDRMPCVLEKKDWALWLGEEDGDPASLLKPPADSVLVSRPRIAGTPSTLATVRKRAARQSDLLG
jgi:hypothetical protein